MRTLYKYLLPIGPLIPIDMPQGAEILHVDTQRDEIVLWAIVETDRPVERRVFAIETTGGVLAADRTASTYLGTLLMREGRLVLHVFEVLD